MRIQSLLASASITIAALCLGVASSSSSSLAAGDELWAKRYDGPSKASDEGADVVSSPDGTKVFSTGRSFGGLAADFDYVTVARNATNGSSVWTKRYNGPGSRGDDANAIAVSSDGSKVFVTGESYGSSATGTAYATIAYNASTGAPLWTKRYNGPVNGRDGGYAIAVSNDGTKVFVTGGSYSGAAMDSDYATVAYDASTGAQLWAKRYNGPGNGPDAGLAVAVSADGTKVFVTGFSDGGSTTTHDDYATIAYNTATGAKSWEKRYDGPGHNTDDAVSIAVSPTGTKVFVTGHSRGILATTTFDYATIAYNASTGSQLWAARFNGAGSKEDFGQSLAVSGDGAKVFVTGHTYAGAATGTDYGTVAYNASTGAKLWSTRYNGFADGEDDAYSIGLNPAGTRVYVTGESYGGATTHTDGATVALNASTGAKLWATRFDGLEHFNDDFSALAVNGDGTKVFVVGKSEANTSYDLVTAAYEG